jgi:hypothetical protein
MSETPKSLGQRAEKPEANVKSQAPLGTHICWLSRNSDIRNSISCNGMRMLELDHQAAAFANNFGE